MNRELKFRIWDKLAEKYIYPDKGYQGHFILDLNGRFHNLQNGSGGDDYIVQQYTGLKDSKGVEIYEGDIVTFKPKSSKGPFYVIRYDSEYAMYIAKKDDFFTHLDDETDLPIHLRYEEDIRVIGNIFENPELIKNK